MMVDIFNPSTIAFNPIGDLTFDIEFEGAYMGTMHAGDVSIGAGSNFVHMSGVLGPTNLTAASNLFSLFLSGQPCRVTAVAPAHVSSVPLYNTALHVRLRARVCVLVCMLCFCMCVCVGVFCLFVFLFVLCVCVCLCLAHILLPNHRECRW